VPNPVVTFTGAIDGIWLVPLRNGQVVSGVEAWIGAESPATSAEMSSDEFTIFNRAEELSQDGVLHLDRGTIEDGLLMSGRHGGLTADQWLARLRALIRDQRKYTSLVMVTSRYQPFPVRIKGLTQRPTIAGGPAWRVDVPFREVG
jgi:hypothetical protein